MAKPDIKTLKAADHDNGIISVALTRDDVRPETLPATRQFLIEAISTAGGYKTIIVDVTLLDHKDMMLGLQYRNGMSTRSNVPGVNIHNLATGDNPTIIKELLYIHKILGFLGKTLILAGVDKETHAALHKAKIDRQLTCKETMDEALGNSQPMEFASEHSLSHKEAE